jgi:hypothetical protein
VDVRGVPGEEAAALGESVDVARVDFVDREPVDVRDVERDLRLLSDARLDLLVQNLALVAVEAFRESADDAVAVLALHREEGDDGVSREADVQRVVAQLPVDPHVGDVEQALERAALEGEPERVPDGAARAVAAGEVLGLDGSGLARRGLDPRGHARLGLRKAFQFRAPEDFPVVAL